MDDYIDLHPRWTDTTSAPQHVNQFVCQLGVPVGDPARPDGLILSIGTVSPPMLVGDPSQFEAQLRALDGVLPVQTVGRFVLSRTRAAELVEVLQASIAQHDAVEEANNARSA